MNVSAFIARRITFQQENSFTRKIINIGITSVTLAIAVMVLSTSLFKGFKTEISNKVLNFWGHIHIVDANAKRNFETNPIELDPSVLNKLDTMGNLIYDRESKSWKGFLESNQTKTTGGIQSINPFIVLPSIIDTKKEFDAIYLRGLEANYPWERLDPFLKEGTYVEQTDSISRQITISQFSADRMNINLHDQIILNFILNEKQLRFKMTVAGIYNTNIEEYDKQFAFVDIKFLQKILDWKRNTVAGYEVVLDHPEDMEAWNDYIYIEELPTNMYSESIRRKFDHIFSWLQFQDINEKVIFLLMAIVSIITMITTYLILILERTRTIGILKSMGASNKHIIIVFLYCAAYIIFWGIVLGNTIALGLGLIQKHFQVIKLDPKNYLLDYAPIIFDIPTILFINIGVLLLTLIFLLIPSILISRISPSQILRFE